MNFDLLLWPMLIPMVIPIAYCFLKKKKSLPEMGIIALTMILIVIFYWPMTTSIVTNSNIVVKFLLFVLFPLIMLGALKFFSKKEKSLLNLSLYGVKKEGIKKSLKLGFLFIPIMIITTFIVKYIIGGTFDANFPLGAVSFIESFTEEFFFRGILFIFLISRTNLKVAYVTSLASFILMHPQNFTSPFIVSTIVQGLLTIEICRRSQNITGAWVLHGANRFFSIAVLPFLL